MWRNATDFVPNQPYTYKIKPPKVVNNSHRRLRLEDKQDFNMKIEKKDIQIIFY